MKKDYSLPELLTALDTVRKEHKILGYAKADNIPFRPKPGQFAIMIETAQGEKTWCHSNNNPNSNVVQHEVAKPVSMQNLSLEQISEIIQNVRAKCCTINATLEDYEKAQEDLAHALLFSDPEFHTIIESQMNEMNSRLTFMLFRAAENSVKKGLTKQEPGCYTRDGD